MCAPWPAHSRALALRAATKLPARADWAHVLGMSAVHYIGPERRSHRVYVTRHTEYFFDGPVCMGVRDRNTGRMLAAHMAANRRLEKAVRFAPDGRVTEVRELPGVGDCLYFSYEGRELITSPVEVVNRTQRELVESFSQTALTA